jgi:hypothetical protein
VPDAIGNGSICGTWPEEHVLVDVPYKPLESPTVLQQHVPLVERALISKEDYLAINCDGNMGLAAESEQLIPTSVACEARGAFE